VEVVWESVKHFTPNEFAKAHRMDPAFIRQLDAFREKVAEPIFINFSNGDEEHQAGSLHYSGRACDIVFNRAVSLNDVFEASRFFTEVGIYPKWKNTNASKSDGGLHVGFDAQLYRLPMHRKYWVGTGKEYLPLTLETLKQTKLI
jgi:hypothetical protein